jgi:hypothetical protein
MNYRCYSLETFLHKSEQCEVLTVQWGAGLAVTGPISDVGQEVLQYSFEQEVVVADSFTSKFLPLSLSSRRP